MKMTKLEWRYLQKIALDHPYYDTHKLPLTDGEAKAIVAENNTITGRDFVDSVYAKLGRTRPELRKGRFDWLRGIGELLSVPPIRRIAIILLAIVLLTVFFAATPIGRAVAESIAKYTETLFENGLLALNWHSDTPITPIPASRGGDGTRCSIGHLEECEKLASFAAFSEISGETPIELPLPLTELHYTYNLLSNNLDLHAVYETPEGKIITVQSWYSRELMICTTTGMDMYDAEERIYCSIDRERGSVNCVKILEDSVLHITAEGSFSAQDLFELLKN